MADGLTKALPRPAMERQRDHNLGVQPVEYQVHDKIFRDNAHKFETKSELPGGYLVHFAMCRSSVSVRAVVGSLPVFQMQ